MGLQDDDQLIVLSDKGHYKGQKIKKCHDHNIDTLVSPRKSNQPHMAEHVTKDKFIYKKNRDLYICPKGKQLKYQGTFKRKNKRGQFLNHFDR